MDLNTIETIVARPTRASQSEWQAGDAWLAGGSWLFSEPQPSLRRLFDIQGFGWAPIEAADHGLTVAATCRIAQLQRFEAPPEWRAAMLFDPCARALLGSFKVLNVATVGGNLCMALPAGPMTALAVALQAELTIWAADGTDHRLPARDFVLGDNRNALRPGDMLRSLHLPDQALRRRSALRRISLTPLGRSGALLIGTRDDTGSFSLTVTASTVRPFVLDFAEVPRRNDLLEQLAQAIPVSAYHDDVHGRPDWRRHVTGLLACEILDDLAA